ncbi:MAG: histidine kinase [Flavobacteriaceae bacterium]|nr:histidine kinase [Flavobacteriaceae bacterium]
MSKEERLLILYFIIVLVFLMALFIVFFIAFQRRKNKLIMKQIVQKQAFEKEISQSKLEIQEQTLKNIAWELHDNVGQLLSVANLQLNVLMRTAPDAQKPQLAEAKGVIAESVQKIRSLSKTLNNDVVLKNGLLVSLQVEMERFSRLKFLNTELTYEGTVKSLQDADEIIIFRILQEFFTNVLKHSRAKNLFVFLSYQDTELHVSAYDDGVGFDTSLHTESSGMSTMASRAKLLNSAFSIKSSPGNGTKLNLTYPYQCPKQNQAAL